MLFLLMYQDLMITMNGEQNIDGLKFLKILRRK